MSERTLRHRTRVKRCAFTRLNRVAMRIVVVLTMFITGAFTVGCGEGTETGLTASPASSEGGSLKGRKLIVASWGGGWTENTKKHFYEPFSKETGVEVEFVINGNGFGSGVRAAASAGKTQWDLLDAAGQDTITLRLDGLLEAFPADVVSYVAPKFRPDALRPSPEEVYHIAFGQTAQVIAVNPDVVDKIPTTPQEVWDIESFPGPRAIAWSSPGAEGLAWALLGDGVPGDQLWPLDVERALVALRKIKPAVVAWPSDAGQQETLMTTKEVGIELTSSGNAYRLKKGPIPNLQISWVGALVSDEGWCVPKDAPNADVAFAFIKWVADHPEAQVAFSSEAGYMTPARDLADLLDPSAAEGLSVSHSDVTVQIDGASVAEDADKIAKAWQGFLVE